MLINTRKHTRFEQIDRGQNSLGWRLFSDPRQTVGEDGVSCLVSRHGNPYSVLSCRRTSVWATCWIFKILRRAFSPIWITPQARSQAAILIGRFRARMRVHAPLPPTSSSFLFFGRPCHIFHASRKFKRTKLLTPSFQFILISPLIFHLISAIFAPAVASFALFLHFSIALHCLIFEHSFLFPSFFFFFFLRIVYSWYFNEDLKNSILPIIDREWLPDMWPIYTTRVKMFALCILYSFTPRLTNNRFILLIKRASHSMIHVTDLFENEKSFFHVFDKWWTYTTCLPPRIWRKIDTYYLRNHDYLDTRG